MIWDPLRRKNVALTPEESVRQWFIGVLRDEAGVPLSLMRSEVAFTFGEEIGGLSGAKKKRYRADIVVYDRALHPVMTVECKRPDVDLTEETARQAMRYNSVLNVKWLVLTNGNKTMIFHRREDGVFAAESALPGYDTMTGK